MFRPQTRAQIGDRAGGRSASDPVAHDHVHVEVADVSEDPARPSSGEVVAVRVKRNPVEVGAAAGCPEVVHDHDFTVHEHLVQRGCAGATRTARGTPEREHTGAGMLQQSGIRESRVLPSLVRRHVRVLIQDDDQLEIRFAAQRLRQRRHHGPSAQVLMLDVDEGTCSGDPLQQRIDDLGCAASRIRQHAGGRRADDPHGGGGRIPTCVATPGAGRRFPVSVVAHRRAQRAGPYRGSEVSRGPYRGAQRRGPPASEASRPIVHHTGGRQVPELCEDALEVCDRRSGDPHGDIMERPAAELAGGTARVHGRVSRVVPVSVGKRRPEQKRFRPVHDDHLGVQQLREATQAPDTDRAVNHIQHTQTGGEEPPERPGGVEQQRGVQQDPDVDRSPSGRRNQRLGEDRSSTGRDVIAGNISRVCDTVGVEGELRHPHRAPGRRDRLEHAIVRVGVVDQPLRRALGAIGGFKTVRSVRL